MTYASLKSSYDIGLNLFYVVEYSPEAYLDADMDAFFGNYSPSQVGQRPALVSIDGGYEQTLFGGFSINGEADLDLQYAMALVGPSQNVTLYQAGDLDEGEWLTYSIGLLPVTPLVLIRDLFQRCILQ